LVGDNRTHKGNHPDSNDSFFFCKSLLPHHTKKESRKPITERRQPGEKGTRWKTTQKKKKDFVERERLEQSSQGPAWNDPSGYWRESRGQPKKKKKPEGGADTNRNTRLLKESHNHRSIQNQKRQGRKVGLTTTGHEKRGGSKKKRSGSRQPKNVPRAVHLIGRK